MPLPPRPSIFLTIPVLALASCTTVRRDLALRPTRDTVDGYGLPELPVSTLVLWGPLIPFVPHWSFPGSARFRLASPPPQRAFFPSHDSAGPSSDRCPHIDEAELLPNLLEHHNGCRYRVAVPLDTMHLSFDSVHASIAYRAASSWSWSLQPLPWPVGKALADEMNPWPD